jgi:hypothetical protein
MEPDDILLWSERQAELLRRRAVDDLDFDNLAEEIADLGKSELRACQSLLTQALRHFLKAQAWPLSRDAPTWRADAIDFCRQARGYFTPSMRQRIDVASLYVDALAAMPSAIDGQTPGPVSKVCPVTLDDLLLRAPEVL